MTPNKDQLLTLGRLIAKAHNLDKQARALREKCRAYTGKGFYTSCGITDNGITINVELATYAALFPGVRPSMSIFRPCSPDDATKPHGRLFYPPQYVGDYDPSAGLHLWIECWSDAFDLPAELAEPAAEQSQAAA